MSVNFNLKGLVDTAFDSYIRPAATDDELQIVFVTNLRQELSPTT